ncbi:DUF4167 domain-containing protein [Paracoccus sediminis]|uniref:DUF4167 domain-containing protein n=1 Tax=Paracoccus sediminis TaxID=1214787 RepID=A0A238VL72_9RHOB|nr:DUF4167 domain-containing protein [Paracoccus sediminis]TBN52255.1 DUF4167 domain-containing protein [Paracoccus sediminis]SNR34986.1 protein of unknown function [Paracoccus sediminis]
MRSSKSRSRNKSNRQRTLGNVVNRVFDSSGPEGKVRGTPQQIIEKYLALARDAQLSNDRVAEQSFLQHAEHYTRMLGEAQKEMAERQQFHQPRQDGDETRDGQPNGNNGYQARDGGRDDNGREENRRDDSRRDDSRRENSRRENGFRDPQREGGGRDHSARDPQRDQANREQPRMDPAEVDAQPAPQPVPQPVPRPDPVPAREARPEGLPDAVTTSEDEAAGPVDTPEAAAKPARSRAPRAPRGEKPAGSETAAPRQRRRKASEGEAKPEDVPAASDE